MGSNFGDLDNDGYLDFYLGTGYPDYRSIMPNVMYRNQSGKRFTDVSMAGGFSHLQKATALSLRIWTTMVIRIFSNRWEVRTQATGTATSSMKIRDSTITGLRLHSWVSAQTDQPSVRVSRSISSKTMCGARSTNTSTAVVPSAPTRCGRPLAGQSLKNREARDFLANHRLTQTFHDVPFDQFIQIVEGAARYTPLQLKKLTLSKNSK